MSGGIAKILGMSKSEAASARWARVIREQRESGQTVAALCARRGLAVSSFYPWKRRLVGAGDADGAVFVEAKVGAQDRRDGCGVTVVLRGGRSIVVGPGFDRQLLLEVIEALEPAGGAA